MTKEQICGNCHGTGPFSPSKAYPHAWCVKCMREHSALYYAQHGADINAAKKQARLAEVQALPPEARTRAQTLRLLRLHCPPGKKVCSWCWHAQPVGAFRACGATSDGVDYYCRQCRTILHRLRRRGLVAG